MFPIRFIRIIPLAFIVLFLPVLLSGQQIPGRRTIRWTPIQHMQFGSEEVKVLHFQRATYDLNTLLPNYYEVIKIGNNSEYTVRLRNPGFQEVDNELLRDVKNLEGIPAEIEVSSSTARLRKEKHLQVGFIPLRRNPKTGRIELLESFDLELVPSPGPLKSAPSASREYADRSVLAIGKWIRVAVKEDGIHALSFDRLRELGIEDPAGVRVYGNGGGMLGKMNADPRHDDLVENAILVTGDRVLFYGRCEDAWKYDENSDFFHYEKHDYATASYYYLTSDLGPGLRVQDAVEPSLPANYTCTAYDVLRHHEMDEINLIQSGREWYGEHFDIVTEQDFNMLSIPTVSGEEVRIRVQTVGRASAQTSMQVRANGDLLGTLHMQGTVIGSYSLPYANPATATFSYTPTADGLNVSLRYIKNAPSAEAWLNYITVNARAPLLGPGDSNPMEKTFRDRLSVGPGRITEFVIEDAPASVQVWDITDPTRPVRMPKSYRDGNLHFKAETEVLKEFIAFIPESSHRTPVTQGDDVGPVPNQNLHALKGRNYVVVSPPQFLPYARRLAAYRQDRDGLDTVVVTPQQIYHEFSSGSPDASAIRDFLKMLYDRAATPDEMPKYVLLYGDGSYDNKGTDVNNTNLIPTYQSANSLSPTTSYVTDDFFGLLDDDEGEAMGLIDIGVGRFPVSSLEEAENVLEKVLSYKNADRMGDWRNVICFIGDDEENNIHMRQADQLARSIEQNYPDFTVGKIYLDAYTQVSTPSGPRYPDVNDAIGQRVEKGALIMNYTGHGGSKGLAHERVLRIEDVLSWKNADRLPLFMTATCEFSRFDEYEAPSAGELVLLNPDGGGIALLTTTRLVFSPPNQVLNEYFYDYVFEKDENGRNYKLGDIIRLTKNATSGGINKRNFTLLGDPALELAYPKHRVRVEAINGIPATEQGDTLKALGKVTVSGYMEDETGNPLDQFNGTVYPTVFDKSSSITTLSNDGGSPFNFSMQNRVLYKGKATVTNGTFSFSFVVPKDISYNYDYGKLSFYAEDGLEDAHGSFQQVVIGGTADSVTEDTEGPQLEVFMNDENFVFGGMTDESPVLLAYVSDSNGINTLGNGIGHDLTALLDGNTQQPIILNDYYEADADSYKSGKIRYSFKNLEAGPHTLKVKVWDVYNNSSEEILEFTVNADQDLRLDHVLNYPNPFTTHTRFFFEHNQPSADLEVLVQVFTVSGKLVKTIEHYAPASGYRVGPIDWDGRDDYGSRIGRGVYIYRLKVRTSLGHTAEKFEKLVILN